MRRVSTLFTQLLGGRKKSKATQAAMFSYGPRHEALCTMIHNVYLVCSRQDGHNKHARLRRGGTRLTESLLGTVLGVALVAQELGVDL